MVTISAYRERRAGRVPGVLWCSTHAGGAATILPDGCMDIIWTGESLMVAGPDTVAASYLSAGPHRMVGLRFDPGVAPSVLGERADALRDSRIDLSAVWGDRRTRSWLDRMSLSDDPAGALVDMCAEALADVPEWVTPTVAMLRDGVDVADAARAAGMSPRTFQRQVNQRIGYGPKVFQRISRLTDALPDLRAGLSLSDVAHRRGYADYPHMHREFKALTGESPADLRGTSP